MRKPLFAISTHSYLLFTDLETTLINNSGYYTGICKMPDGSSLAAKRVDPKSKESPTLFEHYHGDKCVHRMFRGDIQNIHQIARSSDGVYICNTFHNQLEWLAADGTSQAIFELDEDSQTYLNSIFPAEDAVWIVLRHNDTIESEILKLSHYPEFATLERFRAQHRGIHDLYVDPEGVIYYNASNDGKVIRRTVCQDGSIYWDELVVGGHNKGMQEHAGYLYVGVSEHAIDRERRFTADGKIGVINLDTWRLEDMVNLRLDDSTVGSINDICFIMEGTLAVTHVQMEIIDKRAE